jgi:hypothetical protein
MSSGLLAVILLGLGRWALYCAKKELQTDIYKEIREMVFTGFS